MNKSNLVTGVNLQEEEKQEIIQAKYMQHTTSCFQKFDDYTAGGLSLLFILDISACALNSNEREGTKEIK